MIWTEKQDRKLLAGIAAGLTTREIAKRIGNGCTRNMVIGRHKRLRGIVHPCEQRRVDVTIRQRESYRARLVDCLAEFDRRIGNGEPRDWVITSIRNRGIKFHDIGRHVGLTPGRIRQIYMAAP